ncbi:MAG: methyltransferase family protein [Candidatus Hodarchaeales archaeon]|jgi:protein-S-isoprenylcysteine O-methyltransferase Ste14
MIEWINVLIMGVSSVSMLYLYVKSVGPAALEKKIGKDAYNRCGQYRMIASVAEMVVIVTYIIYFFYPIKTIGIPQSFPWEWGISICIGIGIAIPSCYIMIKGLMDAGKEAMIPQIGQQLYQGIYEYIRHPQAVGELPLWWSFSLILNSPFLALYSIVFIPIFYIMMKAEERDLIIRYGDSYKSYMKTTGMVFPKIRKRE